MTLELGNQPGSAKLFYSRGERWGGIIRLKDKATGAYTPWPGPVVIRFTDIGVEWEGEIDPTEPEKVTWAMTAEDVDALGDAGSFRIRVDGLTWWTGVAVER